MKSSVPSLPSAAEYFGEVEQGRDENQNKEECQHPLLELIKVELSVKVAGKTVSAGELLKLSAGQSLVLDSTAGAVASLELSGKEIAIGRIQRKESSLEFEIEEICQKNSKNMKQGSHFDEKFNEGFLEESIDKD